VCFPISFPITKTLPWQVTLPQLVFNLLLCSLQPGRLYKSPLFPGSAFSGKRCLSPTPRGSWEEVTCRASQTPNEHDLEATAQGVVSPGRGPALGPRASPPWLLFRDSWSPSRFCSCGLEPRYRPLVPHLQEPLKPSFSPAEQPRTTF